MDDHVAQEGTTQMFRNKQRDILSALSLPSLFHISSPWPRTPLSQIPTCSHSTVVAVITKCGIDASAALAGADAMLALDQHWGSYMSFIEHCNTH